VYPAQKHVCMLKYHIRPRIRVIQLYNIIIEILIKLYPGEKKDNMVTKDNENNIAFNKNQTITK